MSGPFDHKQIDDLIHVRARLAIMSFLSGLDDADFGAIKEAVSLSDGNLSLHLRKLEEAGYISVRKRFVNRRPNTRCRLTDQGRDALLAYLDTIDAMVSTAKQNR